MIEEIINSYIEYEIQERSTVKEFPIFWRRHGYSGANRDLAVICITRMRKNLGKYEKEFRLVERTIQDKIIDE